MRRDMLADLAENDLILVYGTLRRSCGANGMMEGCEPIAIVRVPCFDLVDMGVPGMIRVRTKDAVGHEVTCEVYRLDSEETLYALDRYESEGGSWGYNRVLVTGRVIGPVDEGQPIGDGLVVGDSLTGWVYEYVIDDEERRYYRRSPDGRIPSGDWLEYRNRHSRWRRYRGPYEPCQDGS